eukprot:SAG22_NODE_4_length_44774_cov_362.122149_22_plen_217_part_00
MASHANRMDLMQDAIFVTEDADSEFILTVWFPITAATIEMGCLELMPGVHADGLTYWGGGGGMGANLPRAETRHEPMEPGDVMLVHNLCPHGSGPNLSPDKVRWSVDSRYMRAGRPSGRDCWPAFIAQSKRDPFAENTYTDWQARWPPALARWPKRRGRAPGSTPDSAHPFAGPNGRVEPSAAVPLELLLADGSRNGPPTPEPAPPAGVRISRAKF